jgi:tetratricopeptide (TPR) repeat protein
MGKGGSAAADSALVQAYRPVAARFGPHKLVESGAGGPYDRVMKLASSIGGLGVLLACTATPVRESSPPDAPAPAFAERNENPALQQALQLYARKDYAAAAEAFESAYAADGSASLLLARAQALRLAGDCDGALEAYELFLRAESDPTYTNAVRPLIEQCTAGVAERDAAVARGQR